MKKTLLVLLLAAGLIFPVNISARAAGTDFVDANHWASSYIQAVAGLGLMNGTGTNADGERIFSPEGTVSRGQLATIMANTFNLDYGKIRFVKQPVATDYYRDVADNAWYSDPLVMCAINSIFNPSDYFYPDRSATRLKAAQSIYRSFNAKGISVPMIMMMPVFGDTASLSQEEMNAVVFVNNTGIMKGYNNLFRPQDNMTRAEMAVVLMKCVELISANQPDLNQVQVSAGSTFYLSLPSNPTTGYIWTLAGGDESIAKEVGSAYLEDDSSGPAIVGRGGQQYWRFQALKPGSTELQLVYARPWESVQPEKKFALKITVTPAGFIDSSLNISTKAVRAEGQYITVDQYIPVLHGLADQIVQNKLNSLWEKDAQAVEASLKADLEDYIRYNQQNNFPIRPYEMYSRYKTGTLNENFLSLYVDYYQYTGGAHGMTDRRPYNFDLHNGQQLALADLFKPGYDYGSVIDAEIKAQITADPSIYFSGQQGFQGITPNQRWYIEAGQLVVYFSQYEIAPYAAGFPEFKIPLARFGDGLQTRFFSS